MAVGGCVCVSRATTYTWVCTQVHGVVAGDMRSVRGRSGSGAGQHMSAGSGTVEWARASGCVEG